MSGLTSRPFRSALYIPASNLRAMEKARTLDADAIIFDLEDAVAASEKLGAREALAQALAADWGGRYRLVRVNGADTPWGADDLAAVARLDCDAVLLPKVDGPAMLAAVTGRPVWAMVETPAAILNAAAIAAAPGLAGLVMGTNDLAKDLGTRFRADRLPLMTALQTCVLAARAHGRVCLDGVYNAFRDDEGLAAECAQGRDLGFDGKTLIHPAQVAIANAAFSPAAEELDVARRQIAAWEEAQAAGKGVAVVDGRIVENLHIVTARALLARDEAIGRGR
jgi:(3S)-malyl-CoA thioesterase